MARNKPSGFGVADDLGYNKVHEVHEDNTRSTRSSKDLIHEVMPSTQGRKGNKMKRINMAFSDENHEWITKESRRRGISATQYVNDLIATARLSQS